MLKVSLFKTASFVALGLVFFTGIALADAEWTSISGTSNVFNTNLGRVGIGTTNPTANLEIKANAESNEQLLFLKNFSGTRYYLGVSNVANYQRFLIGGNGGNALSIDPLSNVGIGTTTNADNSKLHVAGGNVNLDDNFAIAWGGGTGRPGVRGNKATQALDIISNGYINFMINGNDRMRILSNGNVGIGINNPTVNLEIKANAENNEQLLYLKNFVGTGYYLGVSNVATGHRFFIGGNGGKALTIDPLSNIGIGTTNPQSTLAVNGTITTKKIKVTETGWSDFVFDEGYKLLSLAAVESHIKQYKHLPGIPSAQEIRKKGLDVSDVLAKQMQKIEELTLYLIEMQKENQNLKNRLNALEKQVAQN